MAAPLYPGAVDAKVFVSRLFTFCERIYNIKCLLCANDVLIGKAFLHIPVKSLHIPCSKDHFKTFCMFFSKTFPDETANGFYAL